MSYNYLDIKAIPTVKKNKIFRLLRRQDLESKYYEINKIKKKVLHQERNHKKTMQQSRKKKVF